MMSAKTIQQAVIRQLPATTGLRLIEYKGDAMTRAHILPRSKLLVDFSRQPQNGDIVVVQRDNKFTVRFFKCNEHKRWLISANRKYADMLYDDNTTKLAVVVKVITDTTLLRDYMV